MSEVGLVEAFAWSGLPPDEEYHTPGFVRSLSAKMIEELRLGPDDLFVDLCCGMGVFTAGILELAQLTCQVVAVDRCERALARLPNSARIRPVCMEAAAFAAFPCRYDKILVKDGIASLGHQQRLLADLRERLAPGGSLLLVNQVPNTRLPLSREALRRWEAQHVEPGELERVLRKAGFETRTSALTYPRRIESSAYFRLLGERGLPALDDFDDDELRRGIALAMEGCAGLDAIEFDDHFDVVVASVPRSFARRREAESAAGRSGAAGRAPRCAVMR